MRNLDSWNAISPKEVLLTLVLGISLLAAVLIVIWARQPEFRPIVQDMRLVDAVKIADIFDQNNVHYYADIQSHTMYVAMEDAQRARLAMARSNLVMDYPEESAFVSLPQACEALQNQDQKAQLIPLWQQPWFMKVVRLAMAALVLIVFILAVIRPAIRALIYPEQEDQDNH